jgi:deoxyribose-phosphate aldolase
VPEGALVHAAEHSRGRRRRRSEVDCMDLDQLIAKITRELLPTLSVGRQQPGARGQAGSAGAGAGAGAHASAGPCEGASGDCSACGRCVTRNVEAVKAVVGAGADRISAPSGTARVDSPLAAMIDHTLLKADATEADVRKLCAEALEFGFASVCVNPTNVALCASILRGSAVKVCTVIGFPLGATTPTAKAMETRDAIANGAQEVDMVINVGALKSGNYDLVKRDVQSVVDAAGGAAVVKVIIETALLSDEEKIKACLIAKYAGADFVKTSTGFGPGGATAADVELMRHTVGRSMGVKASGGIRDVDTARKMVAAGASRIGASASVSIVKGDAASGKGY